MITFKQYLDEARMSKGTFMKAIERLSKFDALLGFELEMWVPEESEFLIVNNDGDGDFDKTAEQIQPALKSLLGTEVNLGNSKDIDTWKIVPDGSIDGDGVGVGIEIVSPPTSVEYGIEDLKACFKFMQRHGLQTNDSTGIHLNLSLPRLRDKLDPLKLVLFMGGEHVLKSYDRKFNKFAADHYADLVNSIANTGTLPDSADGLKMMASAALKREKYRTVNLGKLNAGYLEFRTGGNADYHLKLDQVTDDIGRFLYALEIACDPKAERQEYMKKLAKLFNKGEKTKLVAASADHDFRYFAENWAGHEDWENFLGATKDGKKAGKYMWRIFYDLGRRIVDKGITMSPKMAAEAKLMVTKIVKLAPTAMADMHKESQSDQDREYVSAFMKAINVK